MIEIKISGNTAEEVKSKVISLFNQLTAATEAYEQTKQVASKRATLIPKEKAPAKETKPAKAEPVVDTVSIEVPAEPEKQEEPAPQEQKTEDAKAYTVDEVRAAAKEFLLADPKERKPLLTAFLHDELKVKDITTMDPSLYGRVMDFVKSHE
ncbi:hypothetical protein [Veillonella seminalis]|uniref:hypothetical protein n=1 Tax=Veillonella seminalis TaxID=1502943 RepID=UPI00402A79E8